MAADPNALQQASLFADRERVRDFYAGRLKTRPMCKPIYDPALPNYEHCAKS